MAIPTTPTQQPTTAQNTSIWAILAIIFAFVFPILGIVFGIVALSEIKKNPSLKGRGLAIAGIIIGSLYVFILIAIFGALFYFGVTSPDIYVPNKCTLQTGLPCLDFKVTSNEITVTIQNSLGFEIIDNIVVKASGCGTSSTPSSLANGAQATYTIKCASPLTGSTYSGQLEVSYVVPELGKTHNNIGQLVARIE